MYKPVMVGYRCGIDKPPENNKAPALTTEMAHRTNSYGLLHILEYEEVFEKCKRKQKTKKSLEQLKKQLEQQEIQGEMAELFVVEYERRRLSAAKIKNDIKRISVIDVAAGYDILSYENEFSQEYDRLIEVKSYAGNPHFHWSQNEIETAELYEDRYYIYLIDILKIDKLNYEPTIIKIPAKNIWKNDSWIMTPTSYLVIPTE